MNLTIKSIPIPVIAIFVITLWSGCTKDSNTDGPECNISGITLTYTANIKGIIDRHCLSCHSGAGPGPDDYRTYEGLKPHLDEGHVRLRVVINKDMPQNGGMTQAERDSINCWILSGYPKQ